MAILFFNFHAARPTTPLPQNSSNTSSSSPTETPEGYIENAKAEIFVLKFLKDILIWDNPVAHFRERTTLTESQADAIRQCKQLLESAPLSRGETFQKINSMIAAKRLGISICESCMFIRRHLLT